MRLTLIYCSDWFGSALRVILCYQILWKRVDQLASWLVFCFRWSRESVEGIHASCNQGVD